MLQKECLLNRFSVSKETKRKVKNQNMDFKKHLEKCKEKKINSKIVAAISDTIKLQKQ